MFFKLRFHFIRDFVEKNGRTEEIPQGSNALPCRARFQRIFAGEGAVEGAEVGGIFEESLGGSGPSSDFATTGGGEGGGGG